MFGCLKKKKVCFFFLVIGLILYREIIFVNFGLDYLFKIFIFFVIIIEFIFFGLMIFCLMIIRWWIKRKGRCYLV